MNMKRTLLVGVGLALALTLGYFWGEDQSSGNTQVIRSYKVNPGRGEDLRSAVNVLFHTNKDAPPLGTIRSLGNDLIAVRTTKSLQKDIADLVSEFSKVKNNNKPIKLEYWIVTAQPGASNISELHDLQPVLESINKTQGEKKFKIVERLTLSSSDDQWMEAKGDLVQINGEMSFAENVVNANLKITSNLGKLNAKIKAIPNEFTIVGQNNTTESNEIMSSGQMDPRNNKNFKDSQKDVYHIIRTSVL